MSSRRSLTILRVITSFNSALHIQLDGRKASNSCMSLAGLLALSGCAGLQMKLGMRVDLQKIPVASVQASQANGPGIAPGDKSPLVVTVIQPDGKKLTTEGKGKGPVRWKDLAVTSTVASATTKGVLMLPSDPRISDGKLPHVTITVPSHPDTRADLDIPLRYDRNYSATFSGASGRSGWDGRDGTDGTSGMMGSLDPDHPGAGGDGTNETDGTDGTDGTPGEDGPPVRVLVALRWSDPGPLLQVSVSSDQTEKLFLVDPHGGTLTVSSAGGAGGSGGRAGRGGRSGSGGVGTPNGRDGSNGMNGHDGISGSSGSGGPIFVTYDPRAKAFLGTIQLRNPGGSAQIMKEAPVGPLW
jgi:hypothetical protein